MKTTNQISLICIGLFVVAVLLISVYFYSEPLGMTNPYVIVRDGDYSKEGKDAYDFFRNHVSSICEYTPQPESATSYDPVNCIWVNNVCPFEGNPKYNRLVDSKGETYVGLVDEFGSLITCDDVITRMPESEPSFEDVSSIPSAQEFLKMDCEDLNHLYPEFPSEDVADAWITRMHECLNQQDQLLELIELFKNTPEVKAFHIQYEDAQASLRDDHISYFSGNENDYLVRMNIFFDENYVLENIDFHCYYQKVHQFELPHEDLASKIEKYDCKEYGEIKNEN